MFQYIVGISVRESEIYQFQICPVLGYHNVCRFQIAMHSLHTIYIFHCRKQFRSNLLPYSLRRIGFQKIFQILSVNILEYDTFAYTVNIFPPYCLYDVLMAKHHRYIKLLTQKLTVKFLRRIFRFQTFQHIPFAIPLGTDQTVESGSLNLCSVCKLSIHPLTVLEDKA